MSRTVPSFWSTSSAPRLCPAANTPNGAAKHQPRPRNMQAAMIPKAVSSYLESINEGRRRDAGEWCVAERCTAS